MENSEQLNKEVNELKGKYESLMEKLVNIEKESANKENNIKQMENNFEVINNNIKELMNKIDSMVEDREASKMFNNFRMNNSSFMNMIRMPMRKATISTMRTIFSLADYASEKMAYAREGLEDIVAEAQYENKKRRSTMMPSEQS
jgi:predicted nuclease with TOPRIM domain